MVSVLAVNLYHNPIDNTLIDKGTILRVFYYDGLGGGYS